MRAKKRVLIISSAAALLSMVIFTVALICGDSNSSNKAVEWVKTVSAGILTSALVTLFAYIGEYRMEKVKALEEFYDASDELNFLYRGIEDLRTEIPIDILKEYLSEELFLIPDFPDKQLETIKHKIGDYLWGKLPEKVQKKLEQDHCDTEYRVGRTEAAIRDDKEAINQIISRYIEIADGLNTKVKALTASFGNIDFMFVNKKVREKFLYEKIYLKHMKACKTISRLNSHIRAYQKSEAGRNTRGNLPAVITAIIDTQGFFLEERHHADEKRTDIVMSFVYNMDCQMHKLLQYIYGKKFKDPEPVEKAYISEWWHEYNKVQNKEAVR